MRELFNLILGEHSKVIRYGLTDLNYYIYIPRPVNFSVTKDIKSLKRDRTQKEK